ncbi:hypothetical protein COP1_031091 [Malus domestica]
MCCVLDIFLGRMKMCTPFSSQIFPLSILVFQEPRYLMD